MNDEFLTHYQPDVCPAFEKALRNKLHAGDAQRRRRRQAAIAVIIVMALLGATLGLPPVRAQVQGWLREIGGIAFVETADPPADWDTIIAAFTEDGAAPPEPGPALVVSLSEALTRHPELADFLPTWIPEGFVNHDRVPINPDQYIVLTWLPADADPMSDAPTPWITLRIGHPFALPVVTQPDAVQEVFVDGVPAALWEQVFIEDRQRDPDGRIYSLEWLQNGLQYGISWREPGLTWEDIRRFAASIPDVNNLPTQK
ncbi:MAG TPA: hypothetical protein PKH77_19790 [Anaerolineae bacterium]|nr:hypothetical protein [Anaerolineae bacterium]